MFISSIIFYIIGVFIHFFYIEKQIIIIILPILIITFIFAVFLFVNRPRNYLLNLLIVKSKNSFAISFIDTYLPIIEKSLLQILFLILGITTVSLHLMFNKTIMLEKDLPYVNFYGEVFAVDSSANESRSNIYVKNIIINNEDITITPPSTLKLSYRNTPPDIGDIINGYGYFFPPSKPLFPYGFNFNKYSFYNKIGSNGFIVGNIKIIENYTTSSILNSIENLRKNIVKKLTTQLKDSSNSERTFPFLVALSLGNYNFLPKEEIAALRVASLSHFISISGYHISLIATILFLIIRKTLSFIPAISLRYDNKKITSVLVIFILLLYLFILGDNIPATRAVIMSIGILLGIILNFKAISLNSLFLACFILLIINPSTIYSVSFLLSFYATMTIIIAWQSPFIQSLHKKSKEHFLKKIIFWILLSIFITLFVEISIVPILIFYFGNIPTMGIIANTIVAPIFSFFIMPFLLLYFLTPAFIADYFLSISETSLTIVLDIATYISQLPFANYYVSFFPSYLLSIFLIFYLLYAVIKHKIKYLMLIPMFASIIYFFIFTKNPDVIVDPYFKLIAIKETEKPLSYIFSDAKKEKFVKLYWLRNPNSVLSKDFKSSNIFTCEDYHCIGTINNKIIVFSENIKYLKEDCNEVDVIIFKGYSPLSCTKAKLIDKTYVEKHGATALYF